MVQGKHYKEVVFQEEINVKCSCENEEEFSWETEGDGHFLVTLSCTSKEELVLQGQLYIKLH